MTVLLLGGWATLGVSKTWKAHGKDVENALPYLSGSFDYLSCNLAEKISIGVQFSRCI